MTECVLWDKAISSTGYGQKWHKGRMVAAHRWAYEQANGVIPDGLWVLHQCDVKRCVNPDHLYLGTVKDNTRDAVQRGQIATGKRHGSKTKPDAFPRGSCRPNSKLTVEQVQEIRELFQPKKWTLQKIADKYGVSISTVSRVIRGDSYADALIEALNKEKAG